MASEHLAVETLMTTFSLLPLMAFALSFAVADLIRRYGTRLRLVQVPNHRSSHLKPTVSGGGLGIAVAGTVSGLVLGHGAPVGFLVAVAVSAIGAIIGFLDDRFDLSPLFRIFAHFALVGTLVISSGIIPIHDIKAVPVASLLMFGVLLVLGVWWINLFNFMDGIDGLAASEAVFILGATASFVAGSAIGDGEWGLIPAMMAVIAACLGFLLLNWPPARIFMGDAGSNYLAFFILAVALVTIAAGGMRYSVWAILPAAFVADATVTLLRRAMNGERWLSAHRLHAYQKLSRKWDSHRASTLLYAAINLLWLYPLALWANTQPTIEWFVVALAYVPMALFCWIAGAGRPEASPGALSTSTPNDE